MGHGHAKPNPDGTKARCGGPAICAECSQEFIAATGGPRKAKHLLLGRLARNGAASPDELIEYARLELEDCVNCLEPSAPLNGRAIDGHHASACAMRVIATLIQLRKALAPANEPVAMPIPGGGTPRHPG